MMKREGKNLHDPASYRLIYIMRVIYVDDDFIWLNFRPVLGTEKGQLR